jgi:hypothetical protein
VVDEVPERSLAQDDDDRVLDVHARQCNT